MEFPQSPVEAIRAGLRRRQHLHSVAAVLGAEIGRFDVELRDGVHVRNAKPAFIHAGVGIQAIHLKLRSAAVTGAVTQPLNEDAPLGSVLAKESHSRNQPHQLDRVTPVQRQLEDLLPLDDRLERPLLGLNQFDLGFNSDLLGNLAHFQDGGHTLALAQGQFCSFEQPRFETRQGRGDGVEATGQRQDFEIPGGVRSHGSLEIRIQIDGGDFRAWNHRVGRILCDAEYRPFGSNLGRHVGIERQNCAPHQQHRPNGLLFHGSLLTHSPKTNSLSKSHDSGKVPLRTLASHHSPSSTLGPDIRRRSHFPCLTETRS